MKIIVTGAGGTVGSYLIDLLSKEGHLVIATDLPGVPILKREGVIKNPLDLTKANDKTISELVRSSDGIIHTAAIVDIGKSKQELWDLNVNVTKRLATAASNEFFCKFIHISSGSIYSPSDKPIEEDYKVNPTNPYELSKVVSEAELYAIGAKSSSDFSWVVLRPALIYGPRARFLGATLAAIPPILSMLGLKWIGVSGGPKTNWVHAEDVARAAIHCFKNESIRNQVFNVADDCPTPFGDTMSDYMEAYGIPLIGRIPLPPLPLLRILKPFIDNWITFRTINLGLKSLWDLVRDLYQVHNGLSVKVDREVSPFIFHNTLFNNNKLKATGFRFKWPRHKDAIPEVIDWYREHEWIP